MVLPPRICHSLLPLKMYKSPVGIISAELPGLNLAMGISVKSSTESYKYSLIPYKVSPSCLYKLTILNLLSFHNVSIFKVIFISNS